jgi:hypothetical protein
MFNHENFTCLAGVYRAIVQVDSQSFCVRVSSIREYLLFKWLKDMCDKVIIVHFGASREFINNLESNGIPYHCKHEFLCANIVFRLWCNVVSTGGPHPTRRRGQKEPRLIARDKMMPPVMSRNGQNRNHLARKCASLFSQFRRQQMWHPAQMEGSKFKILI